MSTTVALITPIETGQEPQPVIMLEIDLADDPQTIADVLGDALIAALPLAALGDLTTRLCEHIQVRFDDEPQAVAR